MAEKKTQLNALGREAAYQLANVTKTAPQFGAITPAGCLAFLSTKGWKPGYTASTR